MVSTAIDIGIFDSYHLTDALYYAYLRMVTHGVAAYIAGLVVGDVIAIDAKLNLAAHTRYGITEMSNFQFVLLEEMQNQPKSCFLPYTG
jgi:hypothetical protein